MDSARYQDLQLGGTTASQGTTLQDRQDRQRRLNKQKQYDNEKRSAESDIEKKED